MDYSRSVVFILIVVVVIVIVIVIGVLVPLDFQDFAGGADFDIVM